jgi:serine/threonine-protein kinase HipA
MKRFDVENYICKGSLKAVKAINIIEGYSKSHLKSFYGDVTSVHIKGTANEFDELVMDHTTGSSISGVQRKMFMHLEKGVLMPSYNGEYIVKPTPNAFPSLSENEHALMKLCEAVGLKTAQCSVARFEDGEFAYITKRFDLIAQSKERFFIEDGASICNVAPRHKDSDSLSYEQTLKQMVNSCAGAQAAALIALRMLIFGYVVGNNDMHLKNFSLYRKPTNKTVTFDGFTPVYDMLSVAPYKDYFNVELSLNLLESEAEDARYSKSYDTYGYYTFEDFYLLAQALGITAKAAATLIANFVTVIEKKAEPIILNSNLPGDLKQCLLARITSKCTVMRLPIVI